MKNPYLHLVSTAWKYAPGMRLKMIAVYGMFVMANVVTMASPFVLSKILNTIQIGGPTLLQDVTILLGSYASLELFFWIFHGNARVWEREMSFWIITNFKDAAYKAVTSLPLKWHKDNHSGAIISRISKASNAIDNFTDSSYIYIETIVKFIISLGAIIYLLPGYGWIPLLFAAGIVIVIFRFDKFLIKMMDTLNEQFHHVASTLHDYISNIGTVITLRLEYLTRTELGRKIQATFPLFKRHIRANELKWFIISMGLAAVNFFILYMYIRGHVLAGEIILIGNVTALYQYTDKFINVFFDLAWKYEKLVMSNTDLKAADPIFKAYELLEKKDRKIVRPRSWEQIQIRGLSFKYDDDQNNAAPLKNISIELARGKRIAFIGESGSGKSTMLALLRGLFDAHKAALMIDKKTYPSLKTLSDWVTLIPQDPEIFENTIAYNVTVGVRHTRQEVIDAIQQARFDRVLHRLPNGLETNIKEKGVNLSGGEKQRLAVARGLFAGKNSSILLLDEPTSSMDPQNEMGIYKNIFAAFPRACVISSVHRLNLLKLFDYMYLFEKGKIVEEGEFFELLEKKGKFARMWAKFLQEKQK